MVCIGASSRHRMQSVAWGCCCYGPLSSCVPVGFVPPCFLKSGEKKILHRTLLDNCEVRRSTQRCRHSLRAAWVLALQTVRCSISNITQVEVSLSTGFPAESFVPLLPCPPHCQSAMAEISMWPCSAPATPPQRQRPRPLQTAPHCLTSSHSDVAFS